MFKFLQKLMIGIVMSIGSLVVAAIGAIGGYLYFAYTDALNIFKNFFLDIGLTETVANDIVGQLNSNPDLLKNQIGLGMFIGGVVVLGGIIVFGILSLIFGRKK